MPDETNKQISERLHQIFPDEKTANRIVQIVASPRPIGWGRKSQAPYYKERFAKEIQKAIDQMMQTGEKIVWRYDTWCTEETGMSKQTLYNRVYQSLLYLLENMDRDGKYKQWHETVRTERTRGVGVEIFYIPGMFENGEPTSSPRPELVIPHEQMPRWKVRLEEWLESEDPNPFVQEKLCLNPDEVVQLKNQFVGVEGVQASVTSNAVMVIRMR